MYAGFGHKNWKVQDNLYDFGVGRSIILKQVTRTGVPRLKYVWLSVWAIFGIL
jgi:hypothetical protein